MTTEPYEGERYEEAAALVVLSYLERNDFKDLCHLGHRLLSAKDGARQVLIWVDIGDATSMPELRIPSHLVSMARKTNVRLDVVRFQIDGKQVMMRHMMNILCEVA